jgi:hypothetical protein
MKMLKQIGLFSLFCFWIFSCSNASGSSSNNSSNGTGAQNSANSNSGNSNVGSVPKAMPSLAKGNGIMIYSVATDYFYGSQNQSPSLKSDLSKYPNTNVQYAFPVIGYLDLDDQKDQKIVNPSSVSTNCQNASSVVFHYYAMPQVQENAVSGVAKVLGSCISPDTAISYYNGFVKNVVPQIEYSKTFTQVLANSSASVIQQVADSIVNTVTANKNIFGIAFDNEPSIQSTNPQAEVQFFGEIATKLKQSGMYLFLFDAPTTAKSLYKSGYNGSGPLLNVVSLTSLYDLEDTTNGPEFGPVDTSTYSTDVTGVANGAVSDSTNPPVMFVAPASATDTMWSYLQGYDMVPAGKNYINPTSLVNASTCVSTNATNSGSIDNIVLSALLCSASGCSNNIPTINIKNFFAANNCVNYTNSNSIYDYFNLAMTAVKVVKSNPMYIGTALYAWRVDAFNDIACGVHYYSQYGDSSLYTICTQQFPAEISPNVWQYFNGWASGGAKK